MKIVYSPIHLQHDPPYEFARDGMYPYSECPTRIESIRQNLQQSGYTDFISPNTYPPACLQTVHDADYLHFLQHIYPAWRAADRPTTGVFPETFALRDLNTRPDLLLKQPGYYCFDAQTPIVAGTYQAALAAAHSALSGADLLLAGAPAAYVLCRPPGHHAGRALYGGYSYLNNAALAAAHLLDHGRVAVLDIDYHHGNGTQDIFYPSDQVLFISLHADPNRAYPFFCGYPAEAGAGAGTGYTHNFPLEAGTNDTEYLEVLARALDLIDQFAPTHLVLSVGLDIYRNDPLGDLDLTQDAFTHIAARIAALALPTLLIQEGGYNIDKAGTLVANLLCPWPNTL
jgi:acetoin utilization deacetylase AcuC-like enzyme